MISPTKRIETPASKIMIEIKDWITGRESEYIQEPILAAVQLGGSAMGKGDVNIAHVDARKAIQDSAHREIEAYIARVGDETNPQKILETILDMPEEDYIFVQEEVRKAKENGKKKSIA